MTRVKPNCLYIYDPVGRDAWYPPGRATNGDLVRVVNLPGNPPANTAGMCHIVMADTGEYIGIIHVQSLKRRSTYRPGDLS